MHLSLNQRIDRHARRGNPVLTDPYADDLAAAYSLRRLLTSYEGAAIRVRRSSDNAEQDIGFDSDGGIDAAALLDFCGAGDGFVATWYDQSGSTRHVTQAAAAAQPRIVAAGAVETSGGITLSDSTAPTIY